MENFVSIRETIILRIKELLDSWDDDPTVEDRYPFKISEVTLGPLDLGDFKQRYRVGITVPEEVKLDIYPFKESTLSFLIEFQQVKQKGDKEPPLILGERFLTSLQRSLFASNNLGEHPHVILVEETGSTVDLDSYSDKAIAGTLEFFVQYRHSRHDVRV